MDCSTYPHLTTDELLTKLAIVTSHLIAAHGELAIVLTEELKAKNAGYFTSQATSHAAREWDAKKLAENQTIARFELEQDIAQFTEEKYLILRILDEKRYEKHHGA